MFQRRTLFKLQVFRQSISPMILRRDRGH
jgi:hypothetical protein